MPEEVEHDEEGMRRGDGDVGRRTGWREGLRLCYYKHYDRWPGVTISVLLGQIQDSGDSHNFTIPATGVLLTVCGQWVEHIEILGVVFLMVGLSLVAVRCITHHVSLSQRRKVLPYIGSVKSRKKKDGEASSCE